MHRVETNLLKLVLRSGFDKKLVKNSKTSNILVLHFFQKVATLPHFGHDKLAMLPKFGHGNRATLPNRVPKNRAMFPNCVLGTGQCYD